MAQNKQGEILKKLRNLMKSKGIDILIIPTDDEHFRFLFN
jgi:hypothetical protein